MTKDQRIAKQKTLIATQADRIKELEGKVLSESLISNELQDELNQCNGINSRTNDTLKAERQKIANLKEVARFFRAQRDRVDAYLSATLDSISRQDGSKWGPSQATLIDRDVTADILRPPGPEDRRPNINEPETYFSRAGGGRDFADYRDAEPVRNWEDF